MKKKEEELNWKEKILTGILVFFSVWGIGAFIFITIPAIYEFVTYKSELNDLATDELVSFPTYQIDILESDFKGLWGL
jgi:type II secretory pathway component PulF